jgi:hypothetical protein
MQVASATMHTLEYLQMEPSSWYVVELHEEAWWIVSITIIWCHNNIMTRTGVVDGIVLLRVP